MNLLENLFFLILSFLIIGKINHRACNNCSAGNRIDCNHPQCVTADGFERGLMSINRQLPGPSIRVNNHQSFNPYQYIINFLILPFLIAFLSLQNPLYIFKRFAKTILS